MVGWPIVIFEFLQQILFSDNGGKDKGRNAIQYLKAWMHKSDFSFKKGLIPLRLYSTKCILLYAKKKNSEWFQDEKWKLFVTL